MIIVCSTCYREYEYNIKDRKGHTKTNCNSCVVKLRRKEIKRLAVEYKVGRLVAQHSQGAKWWKRN